MIIGNDSELRKYIPNVLTTVEGESSLYEKMLPYLEVATDWLCRNVIATEYPAFQRVKVTMVQKCIVAEAFRLAVPSLDVVLTPNGFGIVSTDRIAPASKERIERLQSQLELYRDELIINIITQLQLNYPEWTQITIQGKSAFSTFFPTPELAHLCGYTEHLFDHYQQLQPKVLLIQQRLANEFFSPEPHRRPARRCKIKEVHLPIGLLHASPKCHRYHPLAHPRRASMAIPSIPRHTTTWSTPSGTTRRCSQSGKALPRLHCLSRMYSKIKKNLLDIGFKKIIFK